MRQVEVKAYPGRLVHAVASIGYDPEVALCDLVDNALDAGAKTVRVGLEELPRVDEGEADTLARYAIADDGSGMNEPTLIEAFALGVERAYAPHSLGKFGIGLKSAGLSLGNTLRILTKTTDGPLLTARLEMAAVRTSGKYEISVGEVPPEQRAEWERYAPDHGHGTVLLLEDLVESRPPFATFPEYLQRYCSTVYHMFLEDQGRPLRMSVNEVQLAPIDPLFMAEAKANGPLAPEGAAQWDGKSVRLLLEDTEIELAGAARCKVAMTHLVHPPSFGGDREDVRLRYGIADDPYTHEPRHGFYIYRNRRVIVLAERFRGVVPKAFQASAFRGRLMFDESSDEVLSLDVRKRHCTLPKAARNHLKGLVAPRQVASTAAWAAVGERVAAQRKARKADVANATIAASPVDDLSYAPGGDTATEDEAAQKRRLQEQVSTATLGAIQDAAVTEDEIRRQIQAHSPILFVQGLKANAMWLPYAAVQLGKAETLVNKAHSWVAEAYAAAEDDLLLTVVLHQLFMILGRAELEVRSTPWPDLSETQVTRVLDRYRSRVSVIGEDLAERLGEFVRQIREEREGSE